LRDAISFASAWLSFSCASPGVGSSGKLVFALGQDGLDDAVHQQVGVAPDRAGEMRVGLVGQAEVAAVDGGVDGLAHGAQQHHVDLLGVGALALGGRGDALELSGCAARR
jgi:hypothetical protein